MMQVGQVIACPIGCCHDTAGYKQDTEVATAKSKSKFLGHELKLASGLVHTFQSGHNGGEEVQLPLGSEWDEVCTQVECSSQLVPD